MLVRAVGVTPLWKDSAALCIAGSRVLARVDFKVGGGSAAGYMVGCLSGVRGVYFCVLVEGKLLAVVGRLRAERGGVIQAVNEMGVEGQETRGKMATRRE